MGQFESVPEEQRHRIVGLLLGYGASAIAQAPSLRVSRWKVRLRKRRCRRPGRGAAE